MSFNLPSVTTKYNFVLVSVLTIHLPVPKVSITEGQHLRSTVEAAEGGCGFTCSSPYQWLYGTPGAEPSSCCLCLPPSGLWQVSPSSTNQGFIFPGFNAHTHHGFIQTHPIFQVHKVYTLFLKLPMLTGTCR